MALPRKYIAIPVMVAALMMLYFLHSTGYRPLSPQTWTRPALSHLPDYFAAAAPPYTAAVVYLHSVMPGPRNPARLLHELPILQKNIPWRHQWPVLVLHAGAYDTAESQQDFLTHLHASAISQNLTADATEKLMKRVEFVHTDHGLPEGIPAEGKADKPLFAQTGAWPAYNHMCAFNSYKIFSHPRITNLTYYLRLDDDSTIRSPACFDPFEYMHVNNKSYAFTKVVNDAGWVTEGMWPFVSNYAQRHPDVERHLRGNDWKWPPNRLWLNNFGQGHDFPSYGTNFDLVRLSRFRTPEMTAYLDELASDPKRFYWYRWGTSPLCSGRAYETLTSVACRRRSAAVRTGEHVSRCRGRGPYDV
ncbi:nucleotide-diphospho-sugar transferase [Mycena rosella]|uniref:Nucleotide-diphospho-sugar transferase n=1 Tax=Mycena rosella TaxID=1033263 RepID=A0AAD7H1J2_MYCRO|nr:nucleotide-diphospho-sugar transferase [Mycena rosella]